MSIHPDLPLWDESLIRRYDLSGPRYTSYPTALEFREDYDVEALRKDAAASRAAGKEISLYSHLPFCAHLCYYCACNKVITRKRDSAAPYVGRLLREAKHQADLFGADRVVQQLHWGGGTPTFLPEPQMRDLMAGLHDIFRLTGDPQRDYSVEIDPREVTDHTLETLAELAFNRISLGVQDINPDVQKAVNRVQPLEMTEAVLNEARRLGFRSINLDLIYGLPLQTPASFAATLEAILELSPDRLSVFSYAHLPQRFFPQTRIRAEDLPSPADKLLILRQTIETLLRAGYEYIGMDHFAKPDDSLAIAQKEGSLHRNFQGYTTHADCDLVSLGVSAIGQTEHAYFQNERELTDYESRIDQGDLAITKGIRLSRDDRLRRWVIRELICHFRMSRRHFTEAWQEDWDTYFAPEMLRLRALQNDELVHDDGDSIRVTGPGRLLIRAICQIFDRYRKQDADTRFSRII